MPLFPGANVRKPSPPNEPINPEPSLNSPENPKTNPDPTNNPHQPQGTRKIPRPITSCIGVDDGPFPLRTTNQPRHAPLIATQLTGPRLTKLQTGWITVDGLDATQTLQTLTQHLPKSPILLSGATFGGFNLIDPKKISQHFKTPVIIVVGSKPSNRAVKHALIKHFPDWQKRWEIMKSLGPLRRVRTMPGEPAIYYEPFGCSIPEARRILTSNAFVSRLPEPIRVASILARNLFTDTHQRPT